MAIQDMLPGEFLTLNGANGTVVKLTPISQEGLDLPLITVTLTGTAAKLRDMAGATLATSVSGWSRVAGYRVKQGGGYYNWSNGVVDPSGALQGDPLLTGSKIAPGISASIPFDLASLAIASPASDANLLNHYDCLDMACLFQDHAQASPVTATGQSLGSLKARAGAAVAFGNASGGSFRPTIRLGDADVGGGNCIEFATGKVLFAAQASVPAVMILSGYQAAAGTGAVSDFLTDGFNDRTSAFMRWTTACNWQDGVAGASLVDFKDNAPAALTAFVLVIHRKAGQVWGTLRTSTGASDFAGAVSASPTAVAGQVLNARGNGTSSGGASGRGANWKFTGLTNFSSDIKHHTAQQYANWHWVNLLRQSL